MRLKRFNSSKKRKLIIGILAIGIILGTIIGYSYYTYAFFNTSKEFNVINGTVPEFKAGDIRLAYTINGKNVSGIGFPNKDYGFTVNDVVCDNDVQAEWNDSEWALKINDSNNQERIKCSIDFNSPTMSEYLINLSKRDNSIILQEHETTEQTGSNAQKDYRFIGKNPNNYVCLESDGKCSEDELYQIIGVIPTQSSANGPYENRVKLIKSTSFIGKTAEVNSSNKSMLGYRWSGSAENKLNDWTKSTLNTDVLNMEYWQSISEYHKYISEAKWYLGSSLDKYSTNDFFIVERGNIGAGSASSTIYNIANIGLMYVSDYGYTTSGGETYLRDVCLNTNLRTWINYEDCYKNTWIYNNQGGKWTIVPLRNTSVAWNLSSAECLYGNFVYGYTNDVNNSFLIMDANPSFYLRASVKYASGIGTKDNPYQIMVG